MGIMATQKHLSLYTAEAEAKNKNQPKLVSDC
ncbi:Uncharacterised protein [Vibrio vulnificus]|nr:Uncharacterised protein [Vibrio vulnificus]